MSMSLADARFLVDRALGLCRRGLASLRTRGVRATWQRARAQFRSVPPGQRAALYLPERSPFAPFTVPAHSAPAASIVIPVFNQFAHTLACLRALAAHPPRVPVEVIVVDDGSSDETTDALPRVQGLRYHRRAGNGGFIAACNDGAALARGEFLVFLNNDTVPQPGWLDTLLATFEAHPGAGLVGAQLLYPDGRLQEAGGVVRNDGRADNIGRFQSPMHPLYGYVRRVDYCSAAAVAVPAPLFRELGGFDTAYAPAYYEDTDLGLRVRAAGREVLYQPAAQIVHFEGATSGTDTRQGPKAHQLRNRHTLVERWRRQLERHPDHEVGQASLTRHHHVGEVLVIDAETPTPDRDSGSLRMTNMMRLLLEAGSHVVFLPANKQFDPDYTPRLQAMGVEAWHGPFVRTIPTWLREHGHRFDTVMVSRHYVASEFLPLLRRHAPQARLVFDSVDLHYLRELRGAQVAGDAALRRTGERTRARELAVIRAADVTLVVSEAERALLAQDAPGARVEVLSNLHEVAGPGLPFSQRHDLVFVGGFRHPPNVDAVRWFVASVFPSIRERLPDVRFHCIGGHVPTEVEALAREPGVVVHGHVPDIGPYMDGARVALAPLRYGAGVKGKVNLSMAHGQPVVATSCAVEGMHLHDGVDVLVADDPRAFAAAVVRIYRDEALWSALSRNGLDNVERHFSLDAGRDVVRRVLLGLRP